MALEKGRPVEILLVEDSPADIRLTKEALKEGKVLNNLAVVNDGVEALKYLRGIGSYAGRTTPDLILLDLMIWPATAILLNGLKFMAISTAPHFRV